MEDREKELLVKFAALKKRKEELKESLSQNERELSEAESLLIELLETKSAVATAKYDGIGFARIGKPKLYASCTKENYDQLIDYLRQKGREDLIKLVVMPQSLSAFTAECIEHGLEVPSFITYYLKPNIKLYE